MSHEGLTRMTKVEIVVHGDDGPAVRSLLEEAGARGWTQVPHVSGLGHGGFHQGRLLFNDQAALTLIIAVVPEDRAATVVAGLRRLFDEKAGVMFLTETYVSRPEYFA